MKPKYFEIDGRRFRLEQISARRYDLTIREDGCDSVTRYIGQTAYARAMAEILRNNVTEQKIQEYENLHQVTIDEWMDVK